MRRSGAKAGVLADSVGQHELGTEANRQVDSIPGRPLIFVPSLAYATSSTHHTEAQRHSAPENS